MKNIVYFFNWLGLLLLCLWGSAAWGATGQPELVVQMGHDDSVEFVAFSPDGKTVVSGSGHDLKLWDVATGKELRTLAEHDQYVSSVALSPDGKTVVCGDSDGTVLLWNVATGKELYTMAGHKEYIVPERKPHF